MKAFDFFANYKPLPINPIQMAQNAFVTDSRPEKKGLAQGFLLNDKARQDYFDIQGNPINTVPGKLFQMASVKEAKRLAYEADLNDPNADMYLSPKDQVASKLEPLVQKVLFGENSQLIAENRITTVPFPGMAPTLKAAITLLATEHPEIDTIVLGTNGYGGYNDVLKPVFKNIVKYTHSTNENKFNIENLRETIKNLPDPRKAVLLIQADAYNYTGVNPTSDQWKEIVQLIQETEILPLVDNAYHGLMRGLDEDVEIVRLLAETDSPFICIDSYSKKAGLYGKRVSFLHIVTGSAEQSTVLRANLYGHMRTNFIGIPPYFKIVYYLLNDPTLYKIWTEKDLPIARAILTETKDQMAEFMGTGFEFISTANTRGMFNKLNISAEGNKVLTDKYAIFIVNAKDEERLDSSGKPSQSQRINMAAIPVDARQYIAQAFREVYEQYKTD
ncbi:MAG TPA: aminotransferase class I/II-fold pyridoxal phosphate-dependent enzyme [Candidatus Gracilibacteria bacterium]|nr:aminotransferase class I/II-fold pyridoxal phosphate-dependent enzyme [Candidatus Gracilibacteria bacterium]